MPSSSEPPRTLGQDVQLLGPPTDAGPVASAGAPHRSRDGPQEARRRPRPRSPPQHCSHLEPLEGGPMRPLE
eukprot:6365271-Pyramimonas_sp.AAC.1